MPLSMPDLFGQLANNKLGPLYILCGDEPQQQQECADSIRQSAKQHGFSERQVYEIDGRFDWADITQSTASLSLFSQQRLLELRFLKLPDSRAQKQLKLLIERQNNDILLLLILPMVIYSKQKNAWFKHLDTHGKVVLIQEPKLNQLPTWIQQRAQRLKLQLDQAALQCLVERAEGNLLAAAQELEKLQLLYDPSGQGCRLNEQQVREAVADHARFEIFAWIDSVLAGKPRRLLRQLQQLRRSGAEIIVINTLLSRELHLLNQLAWGVQSGSPINGLLEQYRVWKSRQYLIQTALKRHRLTTWQALLQQSHQLEHAVKGNASAIQISLWADLENLALAMARSQKNQGHH